MGIGTHGGPTTCIIYPRDLQVGKEDSMDID